MRVGSGSPTRFMTTQSSRRLLDVDIPAQPDVLVRLSLLLAEDEVDFNAASLLISSDMALAAAVLKAVNSAMYGLRGRVQSVQQAITYLGTREVASVTFEMGLRAVFPPAPELEPVWERARRARPPDGADRLGARRRRLGRAFGRPVRGMRQGGHVPPRHRALQADAARGEERRGAAAAGARANRRQPRHARRRAVRELGPGAAGGRQRALPRHRQQHARAADARAAALDLRACRRWPMP